MKLFTVDNVADELRVSKSLIYQLIESNSLAAIRVGNGRGTLRVSAEDLDAYLRERRKGPPVASLHQRSIRLKHLAI